MLESLASMFSIRQGYDSAHRTVYLDTFDWRLFKRGMRLSQHASDQDSALRLETRDDSIEVRLPRPGAPAFAKDLPNGPIFERIAPLITVRRLLPRVAIETNVRRLEILDENETAACVQLIEARARDSGTADQSQALAARLQLAAAGGDSPALLRRIARHLESDFGLAPTTPETFHEALAVIGCKPGAYRSKPDIRLEPTTSAGDAAILICRTLLDTLQANEAGVRRDLDVEFLHDLRVAGRRTRTILTSLGKVFEPQLRDHFRQEFRWLGSITGPLRDLDVHLLNMNDHCASLPEAARKDLAPLRRYLRRHRAAERRRLTGALRSKRYRALMDSWRACLEGSRREFLAEPNARKPAINVASKRIWRTYRKVAKRADAITPDTPAETLHKLRVECKKLRYLIELFYSLYNPEDIEPAIRELKRLQTDLGDFNDLIVQETTLRRMAHHLEQERLATVDCLLAMGGLLRDQARKQHKQRRQFSESFTRFNKPQNRKRFRQTFNPAVDNRL